MANKTLLLNEKTQLVNQIMSLAYIANSNSKYMFSAEYRPHTDSLTVRIFDREDTNFDYVYEINIYLEPSTADELQKFKDILEMFLDGEDISRFKQKFGYGTTTLHSASDWEEEIESAGAQ